MGNKMLYVNKTATAVARSACVLGTGPLKKQHRGRSALVDFLESKPLKDVA